ncbi:MAG TPA: hypothetical protein GX507_11295 [Clostridia bacterium]|nr:hypothetical protein [Clostridia bacterium]
MTAIPGAAAAVLISGSPVTSGAFASAASARVFGLRIRSRRQACPRRDGVSAYVVGQNHDRIRPEPGKMGAGLENEKKE